MAKLHFLNVGLGDCIIIEHNLNNITVIDICNGKPINQLLELSKKLEKVEHLIKSSSSGNFNMCKYPTNPLSYLSELKISDIHRFILTHPDMDHMDGIESLFDNFNIINYWDNGLRRKPPDFSNNLGKYSKDDWDFYQNLVNKNILDTKIISPLSGSIGKYFNLSENEIDGGDGLHILSPSVELLKLANDTEDLNDGSYVILYKSLGGKILIAGDSHDSTWEHILTNHLEQVKDLTVLIAPHHGRKSGRNYEFLDILKPKYTLFGCAPSEHLAYSAWNYRKLEFNTNNQCGNIVLEIENRNIDVYIENFNFAYTNEGNISRKNKQDYYFLRNIR
ncbi:hypothetical protein CH381_31685 [Leptospira sp. mixed culture ATI2-C-A1]|nr:hypothetical protein CH381_31685 [Leptospira sp. mixed culture ATI2-C-A1]